MTRNQLYSLADNLQMELQHFGKKIVGGKDVVVRFGDVLLTETVEIISSHVHDDGAAVLVRCFGDLGLLMSINLITTRCCVLDLTKLGPKPASILTTAKPVTVETTELLVQAATVAKFQRRGVTPWQKAI